MIILIFLSHQTNNSEQVSYVKIKGNHQKQHLSLRQNVPFSSLSSFIRSTYHPPPRFLGKDFTRDVEDLLGLADRRTLPPHPPHSLS